MIDGVMDDGGGLPTFTCSQEEPIDLKGEQNIEAPESL